MSEVGTGTLLQRIRSRMGSFTAAEKKFARYVLDTDDLIYRSITTATEESGSGYGTIIRFCQRLGFAGFQDFKIHLALERRSAAPTAKDVRKAKGWLVKAAERAGETLRATALDLDESVIVAASRMIVKAQRVLVVGVAGSYPAALDLVYRLSRMGLPASVESDTHMQAIRASTLRGHDLLVALSFSGSTKEILEAAALATAAGAGVIALTNYPRSPLADKAQLVLCTARWEEVLEAEIGSRLPFHFLVETLCDRIFRDHAGSPEALKKTSDSVAGKLV